MVGHKLYAEGKFLVAGNNPGTFAGGFFVHPFADFLVLGEAGLFDVFFPELMCFAGYYMRRRNDAADWTATLWAIGQHWVTDFLQHGEARPALFAAVVITAISVVGFQFVFIKRHVQCAGQF